MNAKRLGAIAQSLQYAISLSETLTIRDECEYTGNETQSSQSIFINMKSKLQPIFKCGSKPKNEYRLKTLLC